MDPQENDQVAQILGGLKRVSAPDNFESRVQARIAKGEPAKTNWVPIFLKLAVPAAGLAAIALSLYISGFLAGDIKQLKVETEGPNPNAGHERQPEPQRVITAGVNNGHSIPIQSSAADPLVAELGNNNTNTVIRRKPGALNRGAGADLPQRSNGGGSDQQAFSPATPDLMPPGFNTNPAQTDPGNRPVRSSVPAVEVLRYAGIQSEARANQLVVSSVIASSPAERWGVQAGDTIEALNEIKVTPSSSFPSGVALKTVRVRRNGKTVNLQF